MHTEDRIRRLEDLEELRLLMARYHLCCDGWDEAGTHRDPEAIAALFTSEGSWGIPHPRGSTLPVPVVGHAQVGALARELQSMHWIVHFVVNPVIEVEGDSARGEFKGIVRVQYCADGPAGWGLGIYRFEASRTPAGWRFSRLDFDTLSVTPEAPPAA